jgi:hypothetical protein
MLPLCRCARAIVERVTLRSQRIEKPLVGRASGFGNGSAAHIGVNLRANFNAFGKARLDLSRPVHRSQDAAPLFEIRRARKHDKAAPSAKR